MKQGLCNRDIFFAPTGGEIICRGIIDANDIMTGQMCSVSCEAALAVPDRINCNPDGWDVEASSCDATNGGLSPGGQIAIIILCLGLLCLGTFLWQRYKRSKAPAADGTCFKIFYNQVKSSKNHCDHRTICHESHFQPITNRKNRLN